MSWADLYGSGRPVVARSQPDSDRFGFSVDRMSVPDGFPGTTAQIAELAFSSDARVLVLRYPAARVDVFAALLNRGRDVLLADGLSYWRLTVGDGRRPSTQPDLDVAEIDAEGVDGLVDDLVGDIFADYGNHYLADPVFDPALVLAGYQEWARISSRAGGGLVLRRNLEPVALATTSVADGQVEIELAGVLSAQQGSGLYPHLLAAVEDRARRERVDRVVVSTQTHNAGVQRAWARYGFEPVGTFATLHLLTPGLLPG